VSAFGEAANEFLKKTLLGYQLSGVDIEFSTKAFSGVLFAVLFSALCASASHESHPHMQTSVIIDVI
jgi:hypothetical protein